jgi:hypothetical protein
VIEKIDTYQWGWKRLWNEEQQFDNLTILNAEIDDKSNMKGNAEVTIERL